MVILGYALCCAGGTLIGIGITEKDWHFWVGLAGIAVLCIGCALVHTN